MAKKTTTARRVKKKDKKNIPFGIAHVQSTFNNTIVNITDQQGNTIAWGSSGGQGFKGSRKSTPFAAQLTAASVARAAQSMGLQELMSWSKVLVPAGKPQSGLLRPQGLR